MEVKYTTPADFEHTYIVHINCEGMLGVRVMTALEIFDMMDMDDCYDINIDIYEFTTFGEAPVRRCFRGTWSCLDDPLRMEITDESGNVINAGYGTDH